MDIRHRFWVWAAVIGVAGSLLLPVTYIISNAADPRQARANLESQQAEYDAVNSPVVMDIDYGYDGAVKGGRYVPVRITLRNLEPAGFEGRIKILSQESDYDIYQYDYAVSLPADSEKQMAVNIPLGIRSDQLYAILLREDGSEVIRKRIKLETNMEVAELFIGILSDEAKQLQYLDGIGINYSAVRTKTFALTKDMMPPDEIGLDLLDVLLISNFDTRQLNDAQTSAILEWVHKGGTLLIGTGARADDTLAAFSSDLLDEPYKTPSVRQVDMGVEYAANAPGDSFIEIPCADISLDHGTEILSNDEFTVLSAVTRERGKIAVAAYDFVDIATFCQSHRSYVDKLFLNILGEEKINQISSALYTGNTSNYWMIQSMINAGNVDKLPNLSVYTAVILTYIVVSGPILYLVLKHQQRRRYYHSGIVILSVIVSGIIYLMGSKTRFKDTFFTYATIQDVRENQIMESTYINMRTPDNKSYSVAFDPSYDIYPITRNLYYDMKSVPKFTGDEPYQLAVSHQEKETRINIQNVVPFTPKYFSLQKRTENTKSIGFTGDITLFDGEITGSVTNHFDYPVEHAVVLMYGQMIMLGEMQSGETIALDGLPVINYPLTYMQAVAERISGGCQFQEPDINDSDYMKSLVRTNILTFYLNDYTKAYSSDARILAFSKDQPKGQFLLEDGYEAYGMTMLTSSMEVNTRKDGQTYRSALMKSPSVGNGQYYASLNAFYGVEPVVLEYSLGNDITVDKLTFNWVSDEFTDDTNADVLAEFTGKIYFYNHNTGNYDQTPDGQMEFSGAELKPYLSPGNTITVKYVNDSTTVFNWYMVLPMLTTVGRDK